MHRKKRLLMRQVRKALRSPAFTGLVVGCLGFSVTFNLVWMATQMDFLKVLAFAMFGGMFAAIVYAMLVEDPRSRYYKVHKDVYR